MYRYGFLDESQNKLDYVLALNPQDVLERRLQVRRGKGEAAAGSLHDVAEQAGGEGSTLRASLVLLLARGRCPWAGRPRHPVPTSDAPASSPPLACRPWCSSWAWPSPSTTRAC